MKKDSRYYGYRTLKNGIGTTRYQPYVIDDGEEFYAWDSAAAFSTNWYAYRDSGTDPKLYRFKWMALLKGKRKAKRIYKENWEEVVEEEPEPKKKEKWVILTANDTFNITETYIHNTGMVFDVRGNWDKDYWPGMEIEGVQVFDRQTGQVFSDGKGKLKITAVNGGTVEGHYVLKPEFSALEEAWIRVS